MPARNDPGERGREPASDPTAQLAELLDAFRQASQELEEVSAQEAGISALSRRVQERVAMLPQGLEPAESYRRMNEMPEQRQIEAIHQRRRQAESRMLGLYGKVRPPLSRLALRDPRAKVALEAFDRMAAHLGRSDIATTIGLLEELTGSAAAAALSEEPERSLSRLGRNTMAEPARAVPRRERGPDLEASRQRIELEDRLRSELATVAMEAKRFTTPAMLKQRFPDFKLWTILSAQEQEELLTEKFRPKAYARTLVMRLHGLTSPETLKKDRQKVRQNAE